MSAPGDAPTDREDAGSPTLLRRSGPVAALIAVLVLAGLAAGLAWRQYDDTRQRSLEDLQAKITLANAVFRTSFDGDIRVLQSIAQAPVVLAREQQGMADYFHRVQPRGGQPFSAGLFWADRRGVVRVSSNQPRPIASTGVADRSYFRQALATGKPFVSEGLVARSASGTRIVTIAVPTRDASGRLTGVLGGAIAIDALSGAKSALAQLGLQGLSAFDRDGQDLFARFAHPRNAALLGRLRHGGGLISDTRGLDGGDDHVVVWANIPSAGWTVAVDRSRSSLFASARRALVLEWTLIGAVSLLVIGVAGLFFLRARRDADRRRVREQLRSDLARTLGATTTVSEVADAVASALGSAFPGGPRRGRPDGGRRRAAARVGDLRRAAPAAASPRTRTCWSASRRVADPALRLVAIETRSAIRHQLPEVEGVAGSVYLLPLLTGSGRRSGVLVLLFGTDHGLDADEQSLIASHAEQAARALERARVQEREHAVAVTLQRALLAESLPEVDSLDLAARYEAGSAGLEVGGDWYDVVVRPDGLVIAIVGDVAGRGHHRGDPDGAAAQRLPGLRLRRRLAGARCCVASSATWPVTRWPRRSCSRSTRTPAR